LFLHDAASGAIWHPLTQAWQAAGRDLSGDMAQKGINWENEPTAGFMIAKTFFLA
jgi:hypothetical protein